jgi:hypothetical protein
MFRAMTAPLAGALSFVVSFQVSERGMLQGLTVAPASNCTQSWLPRSSLPLQLLHSREAPESMACVISASIVSMTLSLRMMHLALLTP